MTTHKKIASIDVGSNSFLLLLCEAGPMGFKSITLDRVDLVRLGQNLSKTSQFNEDALKRAKATLEIYAKEIQKFKPDIILAKATAAARKAGNANALINICKDLGIPLEIISGEEEAERTFAGLTWGQPSGLYKNPIAVIDIGGGSTEIIIGNTTAIIEKISIPFGAVNLTELYPVSFPNDIDSAEFNRLRDQLRIIWSPLKEKFKNLKIESLVSVAGTPTTLVQSLNQGSYDPNVIDNYYLDAETIFVLIEKLLKMSPMERTINMHIPEGRADIIHTGALLLYELIKFLKQNGTHVSTRGIRHGHVAKHFMQ